MQKVLPHDHGNTEIDELLAHSLSTDEFSHIAKLCSLLSDSTRLRLFWILCHTEECVINLAAIMDMSSPALSHHLTKLREASLITSRREGKEVYYKAAETTDARLLHDVIKALAHLDCPDDTL